MEDFFKELEGEISKENEIQNNGDYEDYEMDEDDDDDYGERDEESNDYSYDNFLLDPAEFTSFISSGYGTRPSSTLDTLAEEDRNPNGIIDSLQLDIPELEPILSNSPKRRGLAAAVASSSGNSRAKMTDLGFKMSKMIMKSSRSQNDNSNRPASLDFFAEDLRESGDSLVDNYGQPKKRQKTGIRGRPKGTTKVGTQFGRASSTHALPPNVSALMGQANVAYVQKQYPKAIEMYLQVVQRAPSSPEPYYSLGLVYEEQGDADKAASYFLITAHLQPRAEGELWRKIAALLVQANPPRKEQAIYCLTRAIKAPKAPGYRIEDDFPLFWLRAKFQLETGQYRSIITGFGAALRGHFSQDPEDLDLFVQVAKLSMRMSLAYVAGGVFQNVFRSVSAAALPLTWSHLNILVELWEIDQDYSAIINSIEEFAVSCYLQGGREQGKTAWFLVGPKEQLEKALESDEMPVELKLKLEIARVHLRQPPFSSETLLRLLKRVERPKKKMKIAVADALSALNSPMDAAQLLLESIEEDSGLADSEMCLKIGQNLRKAGEIEKAIESFLAILEVEPEHRTTRFALSEAYRSIGKAEEALQILPTDAEMVSKSSPEEEFIDWTGLDELFAKIVGIGIDRIEPIELIEDFEGDDEIYSEIQATSTRNNKLRFGPERTRRTGKGGKRPLISSSMNQRVNYNALINEKDTKAGGELLQFFSDNVDHFRGDSVPSGGLEPEEWSDALLKMLSLQAGRCRNKNEWDRLIRIYRNISATNLRVIETSVKWRILGILLAEKAERWDDLMIDNLKNLIGKMSEACRSGIAILPGIYLTRSTELLTAFYHPVTFRSLNRLNGRWRQGTAPLLVLLGHQSLETQNYEEAVRMYWRALALVPQWRFLKLCIGNALLGRAFQRTCPNQLAMLTQSIAYFLQCARECGDGQGFYNAARAMHQAGFLNQAMKFYKMAMESPGHPAALAKYNLSRLYLQCGSREMAQMILKHQ